MTWTKVGRIVASAAVLGWAAQAVAQTGPGSGQGSEATEGSAPATSQQQAQTGSQPTTQLPGFRDQLKQAVDANASAEKQHIDNLRIVQLTVRNVDPANNKVTFDAKVSPSASLRSSHGKIAIDELKPGEQVRAAFDPATGNVVAVEVITPGGPSRAGGSASGSSMGGASSGGMEQGSGAGPATSGSAQ